MCSVFKIIVPFCKMNVLVVHVYHTPSISLGFQLDCVSPKHQGSTKACLTRYWREQEMYELIEHTLFLCQYFWHLFLWKPCLCCYNGFFGTFSTKLFYCNVKHKLHDECSAPFSVLTTCSRDHLPKENKLHFFRFRPKIVYMYMQVSQSFS